MTTEVVLSSSPTGNGSSESNKGVTFSRTKLIVILLVTLFVGAGIGGVTGWALSSNKNDSTNGEIKNDTSAGRQTKEELKLYLASISPDNGVALDTPSSPQNRAFEWLWSDMVSSTTSTYTELQITQRYALATFFYSTNGEGWDDDLGFLSNHPECSWRADDGYIPTWIRMRRLSYHKVVNPCNDNGSLTNLSIRGNDLSGTLPSELSLLSNLKVLQLDSYSGSFNLSGSLPTELGNLSKLQILSLNDANLPGPIPSEIGKLKFLDFLSLYGNDLSGQIPTELGKVTSMGFVYLQNNPRITGTVPVELSGMRNLQDLSIAGTGLTGLVPFEVCNIRNGSVSITVSCDVSKIVSCCSHSCCSDWGCASYGSESVCERNDPQQDGSGSKCNQCKIPPFDIFFQN